MKTYEVIFNDGHEHKIFNSGNEKRDEMEARNFCNQFYEKSLRYSYEFDRYITDVKPIRGGCCLITREELEK